ncbi:polyhydroxyalkanoate synthase [Inquilinus ginsengisoli]|uniref:Polyhydroxyalkanoate synthase n=1 Tax=Inquilinus ginsengisoli TaxID=363840 RepID=A0ABU1JGX6_9PROT|nr:dienelactone hydrolase family protein [Inquilinus ginsengisoli]MDR6287588.1 polyhydroxyalkanoate synthase [Inquilinus ginsengisoli]
MHRAGWQGWAARPEPAAMTRLGPRPLPLHLGAAALSWTSGIAALPLWNSVSPSSNPPWPEPLRRAAERLASLAPDAAVATLTAEATRRAAAFLTGLERYTHHAYSRDLPDPPVLWQAGSARLRDYGPAGGLPLLVVPSLVNRAYVLDLTAERSLLRFLAAQGLRPLLLEWDVPQGEERDFTLSDIVTRRLEPALDAVRAVAPGPVGLLGYCMGGTLAAALAARRGADIAGTAFLAAPWDFHAGAPHQAEIGRMAAAASLPIVASLGVLPVDGIQALFATLDPLTALRKFSAFGRLDPASPEAARFVALEDWLNDGIPLPGPVALECLAGWYGENMPGRGLWRVDGDPVRPEAIRMPSLHLIPARDRIVPPASARALAETMPGAERIEPPLGHIGMVVGGTAETQVWRPLAGWLADAIRTSRPASRARAAARRSAGSPPRRASAPSARRKTPG